MFCQQSVSAEFSTNLISVGQDIIELSIWDIGQAPFISLNNMYFCHCVLLCYDATDFKVELREVSLKYHEVCKSYWSGFFVLVATKCDNDPSKMISSTQVAQFMKEHPWVVLHIETSAKTGKNVHELGATIISRLVSLM